MFKDLLHICLIIPVKCHFRFFSLNCKATSQQRKTPNWQISADLSGGMSAFASVLSGSFTSRSMLRPRRFCFRIGPHESWGEGQRHGLAVVMKIPCSVCVCVGGFSPAFTWTREVQGKDQELCSTTTDRGRADTNMLLCEEADLFVTYQVCTWSLKWRWRPKYPPSEGIRKAGGFFFFVFMME